MEAANVAHALGFHVPNLPRDVQDILPEVGVEDPMDRGLRQTFPVHPHYTFGFTRSATKFERLNCDFTNDDRSLTEGGTRTCELSSPRVQKHFIEFDRKAGVSFKGNQSSSRMGVEGGIKCVKYLIFLFNFIFWITGLALVVLGILVQLALHETVSITDATASIAPIVLIVVGVVIFFIAFFGCCGAWKENYCMITTFTVLLVLIIIIEIAVAVTGYLYQDKIEAAVNESLTAMIAQYNSTDEEVTKAVDHLQENLRCCGVNNASDWEGLAPDGNTVPDSCCVNITERCGVGALSDPNKIHQQGCQAAVQELIEKNLLWIIIAAVVIAVIQILGIVFSCMLMKGIRSGYEVM